MNQITNSLASKKINTGSFRDRSGFVFLNEGQLLRQINKNYAPDYDLLINSGLYSGLVEKKYLIEHEEISLDNAHSSSVYKVIKPRLVPFISYPYEWCFSAYKDAALLTLDIQKTALEHGMTLKDASAYNIQFIDGRPILIDTLSFERYNEGEPWAAYRQFCQHFLAPLSLMCYKDVRLGQLMRIYIDGLPLDLVSDLLPFRTRTKFSLLSHIHLHSKAQSRYADKDVSSKKRTISKVGFISIIDNLQSAVRALSWKPEKSVWSDYYDGTNYTETGFKHKKEIVEGYLNEVENGNTLWDLGSNTGEFSQIASAKGLQTVSFDSDPSVVEINYLRTRTEDEKNILPLLCDLTNPSPDMGWENEERMSLLKRGPVDILMALALIHHLAFANNVPMYKLAQFFSKICDNLIIEFIPKSDTQVKRLLANRKDIFEDYNQESFENEFKNFFSISSPFYIKDSERSVYLMRKQKDTANKI